MADRFYRGNNSDWNTDANWSTTSGGAADTTFPTATEDAIFDDNSGNCTLDANAAALSITIGTIGKLYAGTLDANASDVAIGTGGLDCTYGANATISQGSGTWTITGGTFDYSLIGTFNDDTSTIEFVGTCGWVAKSAAVRTVSIAASGTTTLTGGIPVVIVLLAVGDTATLLCNTGVNINGSELTTGTNSRIGGSGIFRMVTIGAGEGYTSRGVGTTIDVARFYISPNDTSPDLPAGIYSSDVIFYKSTAGVALLTLKSGAYTFDSLELTSSHDTGPLTLETVNGTEVTVAGKFWIDLNNAADVTVDNSGTTGSWVFQGDVDCTTEVTGGGSFNWTKGTGSITLGDTSNQDIDFNDLAIEDVEIDKAGGTVTLDAGFTCDTFTGTAGTLDSNGQTVITVGACDWASGFDFANAADAMNGCTWTVGGNFSADGQTLQATVAWTLTVTGTAVAAGAGSVEDCDASGGAAVLAFGWSPDSPNSNSHWSFFAKPFVHGGLVNNQPVGSLVG